MRFITICHYRWCDIAHKLILVENVKVQREALAESSVVVGRVFGNKMGRRLTVVEEGLFSGIATSTVQVSYTRYTFTCSQ